MENLLDQVRESKMEPTAKVVSTLLSSLDVLRSLLDNVAESNGYDISDALESLIALNQAPAAFPVTEVSASTSIHFAPVVEAPVVAAPVAAVTVTPEKPTAPVTQTRTRVLVVDDDPIVRSLVVRQFSKVGINVDQADAAEVATQMMRKSLYHVVICDLNLPGMSGVELLPKLKAISPLVQVIMLTGDANLVTVLESLENGAVDFVPKARDYASLLPPVVNALSRVDRWMPLMKSRR